MVTKISAILLDSAKELYRFADSEPVSEFRFLYITFHEVWGGSKALRRSAGELLSIPFFPHIVARRMMHSPKDDAAPG